MTTTSVILGTSLQQLENKARENKGYRLKMITIRGRGGRRQRRRSSRLKFTLDVMQVNPCR